MPIVFQHALTFTSRMGYKYLWIDALCIIQDSAEDWANEANSMKDVYKNGVLNLSALNPRSAEDGLLVDRWVDGRPVLVKNDTVNIQPQGSFHEIRFDDYWQHLVEEAPLSRRAWVLQERLLSPRVLYFTACELAFECRQFAAVETFPRGLPLWMKLGSSSKQHVAFDPRFNLAEPNIFERLRNQTLRSLNQPEHVGVKNVLLIWYKMLASYTACGLTKQSDRLVALSGLARYFQDSLRDEYLAGHWKCDIPHSIMWSCTDPSRCRRDDTSGPSWSWASVTGPVEVRAQDAEADVTFLSGSVRSADDAHGTGAVLGGTLRLRARLAEVRRWYPGFPRVMLAPVEQPADEFKCELDMRMDDPTVAYRHELYLMPVFPKLDGVFHKPGPDACTEGLILHWANRRDAAQDRRFERVGWFSLSWELQPAPAMWKKIRRSEVLII